jgi:hypothetical protein
LGISYEGQSAQVFVNASNDGGDDSLHKGGFAAGNVTVPGEVGFITDAYPLGPSWLYEDPSALDQWDVVAPAAKAGTVGGTIQNGSDYGASIPIRIDPTMSSEQKGDPVTVFMAVGGWVGVVTYTVGGKEKTLYDSQNGQQGSVSFDAAIGDIFEISLLWQGRPGPVSSPTPTSGQVFEPPGFVMVLKPGGPKPDLNATSVTWAEDGGVDFSYSIGGADLSQPTSVGLYWSDNSNATYDPTTDTLAYSTTTQTAESPNPYPVHVAPADFVSVPPKGYGYLKAVINPDKSVQESDAENDTNDVASLAIPDVEPTSLTWHPSSQIEWGNSPNAGGVDLNYQISAADLPQAVPIQLFWGNGDTKLSQTPITIGDDGQTLVTQTAANATYSIHIPASSLGIPPPGADDLIAVINPPDSPNPQGNLILTQQNDVNTMLSAAASDVLTNSVHVAVIGTKIRAVFLPASGLSSPDVYSDLSQAKGALDLTQAEAICGVDHFNWLQYYRSPSYISYYRNSISLSNLIAANGDAVLDPDDKVSDVFNDIEVSQFANNSKNFDHLTVDNEPFYDDEINIQGYYKNDEIANQLGQSIGLTFFDEPSDPLGFLMPSDYEAFSTTLVGVGPAPGHDQFVLDAPGRNLNFTWNSNTASGSTSFVWRISPNSPDLPTPISGGIFGVKIGGSYTLPLPPVLAAIPDQQSNPGKTVSVTAQAIDSDPGKTLTYSLDSGAPAGATVDPQTGDFTWAVPASEPPGSYSATIRVTDNGNPPLSDAKSFTIVVRPASSNSPPVLAPIADQMVDEGSPLTLTARATDPDPGQVLTYSLDPGAPAGAAIDPTSGVFTWTPPRGFATVTVVVRVTDSGSPAQSAAQSFQIDVVDVPPRIVLSQQSLTPDARFQAVGTIDDPGAGPWTGTIDYNDGAGPQPLAIAADRTFLIDHQFAGAGPYTAVVTVTDSGGLSGTLHLNLSIDRPGGSGSPVPVSPPVITSAHLLVAGRSDDLVVSFSQAMDPASVLNPGSYRLVIPGHGKKKARMISMIAASYNATTYQVTFQIAGRLTPGTSLQVTVGGAGSPPLRDSFGQVLDGNHGGTPVDGATYLLEVPRPGKTKK